MVDDRRDLFRTSWGLEFRVWGLGLRVQRPKFKEWLVGLMRLMGFAVQGFGCFACFGTRRILNSPSRELRAKVGGLSLDPYRLKVPGARLCSC